MCLFSSAHSEDLLEPVALPNLSKRQNPAHQRKRNTVQYQLYRKRNSNGIHFPCRISKRTTRMTRTTKTTKTATTGAGDSARSPIPSPLYLLKSHCKGSPGHGVPLFYSGMSDHLKRACQELTPARRRRLPLYPTEGIVIV